MCSTNWEKTWSLGSRALPSCRDRCITGRTGEAGDMPVSPGPSHLAGCKKEITRRWQLPTLVENKKTGPTATLRRNRDREARRHRASLDPARVALQRVDVWSRHRSAGHV